MKLKNMHEIWREALATHAFFDECGVPMERIFVSFNEETRDFVVAARGDGDKQVAVRVGEIRGAAFDRRRFDEEWRAAVAAYNESPEDERVALLDTSMVLKNARAIYDGLVQTKIVEARL